MKAISGLPKIVSRRKHNRPSTTPSPAQVAVKPEKQNEKKRGLACRKASVQKKPSNDATYCIIAYTP